MLEKVSKPTLLAKGTVLVKRLPLIDARFEVIGISGSKVIMRRTDGSRKQSVATFEIDAAHLQKNSYLLESEAGPHPLEVQKKFDRKLSRQEVIQ